MRLFLSACLAVLLWSGDARAGNLVINGGFETGNFTGWTLSPDFVGSVVCDTGQQHSGNCAADYTVGSLSQTIATVPGGSYSLDFWFQDPNSDGFSASWGGNVIFSNIGAGSYTHEIFPNLTAGSSSTALVFALAPHSGDPLLDDVTVTANASGVPEPTGLLLAGLGLTALAGAKRVPARSRADTGRQYGSKPSNSRAR